MKPTRPFAVLMIDPHAVFHKIIPDYTAILWRGRLLIHAALMLGIKVWITRHCPDKLGDLDEAVRLVQEDHILDKETFSAYDILRHRTPTAQDRTCRWLVCGVETHICVWQTVRDMLDRGLSVSVMTDAVGSRRRVDHETALQRMASLGVCLSTTETEVYEQLGSPHHPAFKDILARVKECDDRLREQRQAL